MDPLSATAGNASAAWDVLDRLVDDAARLARRGATREAFAHEVLRRAVDALAALGGAAWEASAARGLGERWAAYSVAPGAEDIVERAVAARPEPAHRRLLDWVAEHGEPLEVGPLAVVDPALSVANAFDAALVVAPITVDGRTIGLVELVLRGDVAPDARQGTLNVVAALADCAADHHRERERRLWQDRASSADELERLVAAIYEELDSTAVAYAAANEGRRWTGCDRVGVALCRGRDVRTLAVGGVDVVDRRSDQIRLLERLVALVVEQHEPLWPSAPGVAPPSPLVAEALARYVDLTDASSVVVLPLYENDVRRAVEPDVVAARAMPPTPLGALVCERFDGTALLDDAERARYETLAEHTARALRRAVECESIPLGRWWRRQYRRRTPDARRRLRWTVYATVAAVVLAVPFLIPTPATVEARGALEPERRRELFAPADGIVVEVPVRHGQKVAADEPVVVLNKPELAVELTRTAGELLTAERRLAALRAARTVETATTPAARVQAQERSAEEEQLKETIRALGDEQRLLVEQSDDLTVRAPLTGIVTTWDVERSLAGRPVARGQALLAVADAAGPWVVELLVPERYIGDVLQARAAADEPLAVEFVAATQPEARHTGRVVRIAEAAEIDPESGVVIRTTVAFDRATLDESRLRPGAVVSARIHCGESTLGAVYGRDLWRFVQSWWW